MQKQLLRSGYHLARNSPTSRKRLQRPRRQYVPAASGGKNIAMQAQIIHVQRALQDFSSSESGRLLVADRRTSVCHFS